MLFFIIQFPIFSQQKMEVFFDFNKSNINLECKSKLDSLIQNTKSIEINKIEGFSDAIDTNLYNEKLSLQRCESILDYFKSKYLISSNNFEIKAIGENFVQSKNQSKNRKAIIYFENNDLKTKFNSAKKGDFIKLKNINFENNSNVVLPKSTRILFDLLKILEEKKNLKIEIQGHICCKTPDFYDLISEARAKAVYDFLVLNKINKNRLKFKGFGVSKPIYKIPEQNEYEREQNRRVEILILEN
jgi:outer membrane protein OmpA-like peptidoglycan-associated protein